MPVLKPVHIKLLSAALLCCWGIVVYSNSFHCPFQFDDALYIVNNPSIKHLRDVAAIWRFCPCRFITFFSIALNYHFARSDVFSYHVFNLVVHLATALLVWWFALLTFRDNRHAGLLALLAGLVFVSHPVATEAVTYIWQRAASMAALFYMACLCFYARSCYIPALIMAVAAMFTKENAVTLPLMLLLYEFSFSGTDRIKWGRLIPFFLTLLIIPLTMLLTRSVRFDELHLIVSGPHGISPLHYLLTEFRVVITYIRLLFLPVNQNLDYEYPVSQSLFEWPTLISFLSLLAVLFGAWRLFSKERVLGFSVFWFFLTLLPESSILPQRDVIFEHRLYLPLVGYSLFLVSAAYYLVGKKDIKIMAAILLLVIGCNSVLTCQRNMVWKDELTLWNDTIKKSPHKARPHNNRGKIYMDEDRLPQAMFDFNEALKADPLSQEAYNNRGITYTKEGKLDYALADLNKAIEIDPRYVEAYSNRGIAWDKKGNWAQALADYSKAIALDPRYAQAYNNRGVVYDKEGNLPRALSDYQRSLELKPDNAQAYTNIGNICTALGKFPEAIANFDKAIEINPGLVDAYINRGITWDKEGRVPQAMADYSKTIALDPALAKAYDNRGVLYAREGRLGRAMADFNKAIGLDPRFAEAYRNRGLGLDKGGRYIQAIADYNKAVELNPAYAQAYLDRGNVYAEQKNLTQAILDYNKAIALIPDYAQAYHNRAVAYYQLKKYDKAQTDMRKAQELGKSGNAR